MQWQRRDGALVDEWFVRRSGGYPASAAIYALNGRTVMNAAGAAAPEGSRWCIQWQHSISTYGVGLLPQPDWHVQLERSHQPDFAAELGHIYGRGEQVSDGEGGYWINTINEPVANNRYVLRVGSTAVNHRVMWPDGEHPTVSLSERAAGQRVTIALSLR